MSDGQRVMVLGSGGREHALLWKLAQSERVGALYAAPGNGGTAQLAQSVPLAIDDLDGLVAFAARERIDLTVVGPDDALAAGIVDRFSAAGLRISARRWPPPKSRRPRRTPRR